MSASCISLLLILISCALRMGIDGLPINRRDRGDIIAGADFLSVLMESPALIQAYKELSTTELPSVTRLSRSTSAFNHYELSQIATNPLLGSPEPNTTSEPPKFTTTHKNIIISLEPQSSEINPQTVKAPIGVEPYIDVTTVREENMVLDEHSSFLPGGNTRLFNPIQAEQNPFPDYSREYPGKVKAPSSSEQEVTQSQSIIYHNNPVQSENGRSVSYSTVIQSLPKREPDHWNDENQLQHHGERRERHYDLTGSSNENTLEKNIDKFRNKPWEKPEQHSTERNWEVPEKDHGMPEKHYPTLSTRTPNNNYPIIYGKPEENYEVDEAVSVMSSGRVHGVQPPNKNDNQKVGYVVEGRNYRKYRVEERTSDGFIVGEYGVVSHGDGSLRGVRYTADGTINPRIVYDALMKFLSL